MIKMSHKSKVLRPDKLRITKSIFYDSGADAKLTFRNGEQIKVNKALLASNGGDFFYQLFFGQSVIKDEHFVLDFDLATFQLFLDCLMGFRLYTVEDSLAIFPIVRKYRCEESLKKCIQALTPNGMNENVCHALNLALRYDCLELVDQIINFLKGKFNIVLLLEKEEFCSFLEPISVAKLVEHIEMNSRLVKTISNWAASYMKKNEKPGSVVCFLKEHNILQKVQKFEFESFQSIFDSQKDLELKDLFTAEQYLLFVKDKIAIDFPRKFPSSSAWVSVYQCQKIVENISFNKLFDFNKNGNTILQVWTNEIIFMDWELKRNNPVSCVVSFTFTYRYPAPADQDQNDRSRSKRLFRNASYFSQKFYCATISSESFACSESNALKKDKKSVYEIVISPQQDKLFISTFNISYTFNVNCKILKTSTDGIFTNDNKNLYFTYDIVKKSEENSK